MTGPICVGDPDGVPESRRGQSVRLFDTIRHLVESRNGQPLDDPAALRGPIGEPVESPWFLAGPEVQDYLSKMARQMSAALDKMLDEADAKMRLGLGNCEGLRAVLADDRTFGEPVMGAQEKRAFIVPDISPFIRQMEREIEEQDARNMQKWEAINRAVGRGDVIRSTGWPGPVLGAQDWSPRDAHETDPNTLYFVRKDSARLIPDEPFGVYERDEAGDDQC